MFTIVLPGLGIPSGNAISTFQIPRVPVSFPRWPQKTHLNQASSWSSNCNKPSSHPVPNTLKTTKFPLYRNTYFYFFWIADEITLQMKKNLWCFKGISRLLYLSIPFEFLFLQSRCFSKKNSRQMLWPELGHAQFNICKMFTFKSEMAVNASLRQGKGARKISCQLAFATTPAKKFGVRGISK